jgi:large subunit ribosomal protein L16
MIFLKNKLKTHKPSINSTEYKSTLLYRGRFGLKVLQKGWLSLDQFNACKHFFRRFLKKKQGTLWYRLFTERYLTKKSLGNARMGKGKGALDTLMLYVKKGQILFEIRIKDLSQIDMLAFAIKNLLKQCQNKVSLATKILVSKK